MVSAVVVLVASEVGSEVASEVLLPYKIMASEVLLPYKTMMMCYQESQIHQNCQGRLPWTTEIELTGGECQSQKGVKTSKVCQRSTIGNY